MVRERIKGLGIVVLALAVTASCSDDVPKTPDESSARNGKLAVCVVNYPLKYFAERIGGDSVNVQFPAPADEDPAYWSPDAEQIAVYQEADVILLNGAKYAKWVDRVSLPQSKLVDTSRAFKSKLIQMDQAVTHSHGPKGKHAHGDWAFTTWLDFTQAIEQARAVTQALLERLPDQKQAFEANFANLKNDLHALDEQMKGAASVGATPLIVSHPVYQYLSRR